MTPAAWQSLERYLLATARCQFPGMTVRIERIPVSETRER
jgi:hypothetical protein